MTIGNTLLWLLITAVWFFVGYFRGRHAEAREWKKLVELGHLRPRLIVKDGEEHS